MFPYFLCCPMKNLHFPWLFPWKPPFLIGKFPTSVAPAHPWHRSSIKARNSMPSKIMEPPLALVASAGQITRENVDEKKLHCQKDAWKPIDIGINHLSTGAGILPSIVKIWKNCIVYPNRWPFHVWSQVACEKYSTSYKFHRTCLDNMSLSLGPRICLEELKGLNKCAG